MEMFDVVFLIPKNAIVLNRYLSDYMSEGELTLGENGYFFSSLCIVVNYIKAIGESPVRLSLSGSSENK
jgi:hypothetical protein